ncbi:MAG: flippase-like domain-containing protein [Planctomycetaceae bacterium]|jgi:uncharacterized protein (TIRG00374 family)|nr:flippase-like domain-containing protein [Planctomycetaceae bacterium]
MKKSILLAVKLLVTAAILFYLFHKAIQNNAFEELKNHPKNWSMFAAALLCNILAVLMTFFRWQYLARTLGVTMSAKETVRIGLIGFLFNLAPFGIVGGDLIRSLLLFKQIPEKKPQILASVFVDRIIGIFVMILVGGLAVYLTGFQRLNNPIAVNTMFTLRLFELGVLIFVILVVFLFMINVNMFHFLNKIPKVGRFLHKIIIALMMYRNHMRAVFIAALMTFPVHILFSTGIWCIAVGIYTTAPSILEHQILHPVANLTSMIPLPLGPYEYVIDYLYPVFAIPESVPFKSGYGLVIALVYRLITLLIACLGTVYYFADRSEIQKVLSDHPAEG